MFERTTTTTTTTTTTEEEQKEEQKVNTKIVHATVPVHPLGDFDAKIEHRNIQEIQSSVDVDRDWETRGCNSTYSRTSVIFWYVIKTVGNFSRVRENEHRAMVGGARDRGDGKEAVRKEEVVRFGVGFGRGR